MPSETKHPDYEAGMKVIYDGPSRRVILNFRGRVIVLPETYEDERAGRIAGEQHCRKLGWIPARRTSGHIRSAWD